MQVWKYESMQVCKYANMQVCKHASMQVWEYASMQVCTNGWMVANFRTMASMQECEYASMQVCKYANMEVCKYTQMNGWCPNLELKSVAPPGGQNWNYGFMVVKFGTMASGATWWQNMELWLVAPAGGQNWNYTGWSIATVNYDFSIMSIFFYTEHQNQWFSFAIYANIW